MTPITVRNVSFAYPPEDGAETSAIFTDLNLDLPGGFTFLVGPNGIGKSTLMLLAGARLFPQSGSIAIGGRSTAEFINAGFDVELEIQRNELVSFVYQNMEFETEESVGDLLSTVGENGANPRAAATLIDEVVSASGLADRLAVRMHELSKGEMQRAIVAMSILYGSPVVMMDEPVFAVEPHCAEELFAWLKGYCASGGIDIYVSVHDVKLAERFGDSVILMHTDGAIETGEPATLLSRDRLETAFRAPFDTLYQRQGLYRELLNKSFGGRA